MATINNTITQGVTLATSGTYASPLTITSVGYVVDNSGTKDAVYGPNTQAWTVVNQGRLTSSGRSGINLRAGGLVDNSGTIVGTSQIGVDITGGGGTVINAGTILGGATAGVQLFSGVVANQAGGFINASTGRGVSVVGSAGSVTNLGSIAGPNDVGVILFAGGEVINGSSAATGAAISGNQAGVQLLFTPAGSSITGPSPALYKGSTRLIPAPLSPIWGSPQQEVPAPFSKASRLPSPIQAPSSRAARPAWGCGWRVAPSTIPARG